MSEPREVDDNDSSSNSTLDDRDKRVKIDMDPEEALKVLLRTPKKPS